MSVCVCVYVCVCVCVCKLAGRLISSPQNSMSVVFQHCSMILPHNTVMSLAISILVIVYFSFIIVCFFADVNKGVFQGNIKHIRVIRMTFLFSSVYSSCN